MKWSRSDITIFLAILVILSPCALCNATKADTGEGPAFMTRDGHLGFSAKINGKPVRLIIDTGSEQSILWSSAADRLEVAVSEPLAKTEAGPGFVGGGLTQEFEFTIGDSVSRGLRFVVVESPPPLFDLCDGVFGWYYLRQNVTAIEWGKKSIEISGEVRTSVEGWQSWPLSREAKMAAIEIGARGKSGPLVYLDTGGVGPVHVSQKHWKDLIKKGLAAEATLEGFYIPSHGFVVAEQRWADRLEIGKLVLQNVLVAALRQPYHPRQEATLPINVLKRFDLVIDGPNNVLYMKPRREPRHPWKYNRIAAVFIPKDLESNALVAHVIENGPAYRAGVRPGDELRRIGNLDVTKWRTDPRVLPLSRFWQMPPGTKLKLRLLRHGEPLEVTVTLERLFPPADLADKK